MPELWQDMIDWPGYAVSNQGRVKSKYRVKIRSNGRPCTTQERVLKQSLDSSGYYQFHPYRDDKRYHVLVAREVYKAFTATIPDGWHVDHLDSDQTNNRAGNLQCLTHLQHERISRQRRVDAGYEQGYAAGYAAALKETAHGDR